MIRDVGNELDAAEQLSAAMRWIERGAGGAPRSPHFRDA
jgi:hypothetical protein